MKNFGVKSDLALDFLRHDAHVVISKTYQTRESERSRTDYSYREYDKAGRKLLSIYYDEDDIITLRQVVRFDNKGNEVGYSNYDENNSLKSIGEYQIYNSGKISGKFHDGECQETYLYDIQGNLEQVLYPNTGAKDIYQYDSNRLAVKQLSIQGDGGNMFASLFGGSQGPKRKLTLFSNDNLGNILEMRVYNQETSELLFTQKNHLNSNGDISEGIGYNGDGSIHAHMKYVYKYDYKGNWISKQTLSNSGQVYRELLRDIKYHS